MFIIDINIIVINNSNQINITDFNRITICDRDQYIVP